MKTYLRLSDAMMKRNCSPNGSPPKIKTNMIVGNFKFWCGCFLIFQTSVQQIEAQDIKQIKNVRINWGVDSSAKFLRKFIEKLNYNIPEQERIRKYTSLIEICNYLRLEVGSVIKNQKDEYFYKYKFNKATAFDFHFQADYVKRYIEMFLFLRALDKMKLEDHRGALFDLEEIINNHSDSEYYAESLFKSGLILLVLEDKNEACLRFSRAGENGFKESYELIKKYCIH
jgi:hypothetical protein